MEQASENYPFSSQETDTDTESNAESREVPPGPSKKAKVHVDTQ